MLAETLKSADAYDPDGIVNLMRKVIHKRQINPETAPKIVIDAFSSKLQSTVMKE